MDRFTYTTKGVCSRAIEIEIENNVIQSVRFVGGCSGNTQGVAALIRGMEINDAIERISGICCGAKNTSCPDQLATALRSYLEQK